MKQIEDLNRFLISSLIVNLDSGLKLKRFVCVKRLLNRKLKIKSDPLFASPATRNAVETRGIAILPYVPKLSEKLKLTLLRHGIRTVFKPPEKLDLLSSFKDAIEPGYRQGAIYKIYCSDCDQCYIGETKRWFETCKKGTYEGCEK